ncbi:MAG: B12-binding domain-containing radical SAM protein [Smithella sp.]|nr:B12-binding domain-containing radical SAM protein [Smithella sp.]HQI71864.1 radical SAM protein [Smithella sp.]
MRKILFIHPRVGYMDAQRNRPAPPLGILAAVSFLKNTYEINVLDQRLFSSDRHFYDRLRFLLQEKPLYVGLSVYTGKMITFALEISKYIKENSSIPVVWGGIHPSLLPKQTLENPYIDYVIQGEGELTLPEFSDMLAVHGQNLPPIKGVWLKKEEGISFGGERDFVNLQMMPAISYELIDLNHYVQYYNGKKYIYYQATRGCPRQCAYCYNLVFNKGKFRANPVEKIIGEIKNLRENFFFEGIYFIDDNIFALGKEYIMNLGEGLSRIGLSWAVQGSDIVALKEYTEDDFKVLENFGLTRLTVGVESASGKIRTLINKKGNATDIEQVMRRLSKTNILIWCSYIINFPGETLQDLRESIRFILRLQKINRNVRNSPFYKYTPYPGTPLYERYKDIFPGPEKLEEWGRVGYERKHSDIFVDHLKDPAFFQSLFLTSLLDDNKVSDFSESKLLICLANGYRPIARWRLKKLFFNFNIELFLFKKFFPDIF